MIVYKKWSVRQEMGLLVLHWDGWFLFGIIPLYIRRLSEESRAA